MSLWKIEQTPNRNLLVLNYGDGDGDDETVISLTRMVQVARTDFEAEPNFAYMDCHIDQGRFLVVARIGGENYRFFFASKEEQEELFLALRELLL